MLGLVRASPAQALRAAGGLVVGKWLESGAVPTRVGVASDRQDKKTSKTHGYGGESSEVPAEEPQEDTKGSDVAKEHEALVVQAGNKMRAARQTFLKVERDLECRVNQLSHNEYPCAILHARTHKPPNHMQTTRSLA